MMKNAPRIDFTTRFNKQRKKAPLAIKEAFLETLNLFLEDPKDPRIRNHGLRGIYASYRSIDVTNDWRALFKEKRTKKETIIIFHQIGTHEQLYGKRKSKIKRL